VLSLGSVVCIEGTRAIRTSELYVYGNHYTEEENSHIRSLIFVGFRLFIYYVHEPQSFSHYTMRFSGLEDWESMSGKGEGVSVFHYVSRTHSVFSAVNTDSSVCRVNVTAAQC
jgi:hypothetical protein